MKKTFLILFTIFTTIGLFAQTLPKPANPARLVNDFAQILDRNELVSLENKLVDFNKTTSTQITVVTVPSLADYEVADYADRIAEDWGIGQEGKNNGVLILLKPKNESPGQVTIRVGYGLEHVVTDAVSGRIVDHELIPKFKENDYYGGLNQATSVLMELTKGEYTADNYLSETSGSRGSAFGAFFTFMMIVLIFRGIFGRRKYSSVGRNSSLPFWIAAGMMSSNRSHGGSFGNFSSGSGGFGGFGGGSFGGGGASGSW